MDSQYPCLGERLTLISVTLANAFAKEFSKEDIFILAAFLASVASNLYLLGNTRLSFPLTPAASDEGEALI
ncbi:MAG: hypothetical protein Q8878_07485 [Bacillota bacterium]|nr:hypothetical protein [Bacillota bacterium]